MIRAAKIFLWQVLLISVLLYFAGFSFWSDLLVILSGAAVSFLLIRSRIRPENEADLEDALYQAQEDLQKKTEALEREREELAILMSALSDAILAVDLEGNPLFFNSRFVLLFGDKDFSSRRPKLGEVFRDPEVLEAFDAALRQGRSGEASSMLHVRTSHAPRFFSLSVAPLRKEGGAVYGAVGIFHDVTALKTAEKIRIEFVANVSHELRTPLTAIKGYTDTLRSDLAQKNYGSAEKFLEVISRNVDRLQALIKDLLELSSLESSQGSGKPFEKEPVDTRELTERVVAQLESRRSLKAHVVDTSFSAGEVWGEAGKIEQVLTNLLENAIKYTPEGGKIQVRWEEGEGAVCLHVIDNGPGIPSEHHSRLFERFYRIDQGRSRDMGGTGLGLAIVKHIMQLHGGSVYVKSELGKGAEFVCRFPAPA